MILTLQNMVDVQALQEIQDRFADATGLGVVITDENGVPVTHPSNFTSFCSFVRTSEEGLRKCMLSDERIGMMAAKQGKPVIHRCHSGMVDMAAPITLNGNYLGAILCGQILIEDQDKGRVEQIRQNTNGLPLDQDLLEQHFQKIEFTSQKRVEAAAEMLFLISNYIVKMGAAFLAQEELNAKNERLVEELRLRAQLEETLKETQLKVLQSQINPHFLFNTLNAISRLAYLENAEKTQNITYSLAKILRYSLRNIDRLVSLGEELDFIRNYLHIQQSRFPNKIVYEQTIDFNENYIKIPLLCLQPIIENSIVHGFEPQGQNLKITLHGYIQKNHVILEMADNGIGMDKHKTRTILSDESPKSQGHTTGIGILNVHKRIQHSFGEAFGITKIKSQYGIGTMIQITIPKLGGDLR